MERPQKTTNEAIVIVCEGRDTEPAYIKELREEMLKWHKNIYIQWVPTHDDAKNADNRDLHLKKLAKTKGHSRPSRSLSEVKGKKSGKFYWLMEEDTIELYDKYKMQPVRYVREAQLFLKYGGATEAWAVFDHDDFPARKDAWDCAAEEPKVEIAFNAIAFEEWLLLHFERNATDFKRSCCKNDKDDRGCGDSDIKPDRDCHGSECVAGRLRECKYIPHYSKADSNLFATYTRPRLNFLRINAAWIKTLHADDTPEYDKRPYTNFDRLLERMLGLEDRYVWLSNPESARIDHCDLNIAIDSDSKSFTISNIGSRTFLFKYSILDQEGHTISDVSNRLILQASATEMYLLDQSSESTPAYISLENNNIHYILPIP